MFRILYLLSLLLVLSAPVVSFAQDNGDIEAEDKKEKRKKEKKKDDGEETIDEPVGVNQDIKTKWGVFANVCSGVTIGGFGKLKDDLRKPELLGQDLSINFLGSQYGGNLYFQIGNRFLVGGGFTGFNYTASEDPKDSIGQAAINANFFTGNVGFILFQKYRVIQYRYGDSIYVDSSDGGEKMKPIFKPDFKYHWCLYPYAGFGVGKANMKLSNYSSENLQFGPEVIERSSISRFTANLMILDLGLGVRFRKGKKGGLQLGAEMGGYFNLGGGEWKNADGVKVADVSPAALTGGYLKLTVGGGFFSIKDPQAELEKQRREQNKANDAFVEPGTVKEEKPKKEKKAKEKKVTE